MACPNHDCELLSMLKKKKKVVKRLRSKGGFVVLLWKGASLPGSRGDMGIKLKLKSIKH